MHPFCKLLAKAGLLAICFSSATGFRTWLPVRELQKQANAPNLLSDYPAANSLFPAHNLTGVPVDHFHNDSLYEPHVNDTFNLRYWFDARHYRPKGPVLVLLSGETSGEDRLPFMQKGILAQLAEATHGLAVVLEHRYYGTSFPYDNLTTYSLRFLRTEQALADTAYFAEHVRFPIADNDNDDLNLAPSSDRAPWIVYGGSYAGAFAAFLRVLYPDLFWGAISSSGVTEAVHDYWRYYEAQRLYGPPVCVNLTQTFIHIADQVLLAAKEEDLPFYVFPHEHDEQALLQLDNNRDRFAEKSLAKTSVANLKALFGFGNITYDDDFAALLSDAMGGWQDIVWDPKESSPAFGWYCSNVTSERLLYPELGAQNNSVQSLLAATSYSAESAELTTPLLNFIGWVQATHPCPRDQTQDTCFSNRNEIFHQQSDLQQLWRSWTYQYCTQWGYLATGSGVPADQRPLVSRLLDLEYLSIVCREAFNVTEPPDVESINRLGGLYINYPRLAIVDGEADPWRAATPHAFTATEKTPGNNRTTTKDEPFLLIGGKAVHHWDEYGLLSSERTVDLPPAPVREVQAAEVAFVQAWVADWAGKNLEGDDGRL